MNDEVSIQLCGGCFFSEHSHHFRFLLFLNSSESKKVCGEMLRPSQILLSAVIEILRRPFSTLTMYVRCKPASSPSCSWLMPFDWRSSRILWPICLIIRKAFPMKIMWKFYFSEIIGTTDFKLHTCFRFGMAKPFFGGRCFFGLGTAKRWKTNDVGGIGRRWMAGYLPGCALPD